MPHRRAARRFAGWNLLRWELATVVVFHAGFGLVILLAPENFVITPATWSIFYYLHRDGMGAFFLLTAAAAAACWVRPRPAAQLATWLLVYILGAGWLCGFVLAIKHGTGGGLGVIFYSVVLALWASTAVRLGLGDGGTGVVVARSSSRRAGQ